MRLGTTTAMRNRGANKFFKKTSQSLDDTYTSLMRLLALKRSGGSQEKAISLVPDTFIESYSSPIYYTEKNVADLANKTPNKFCFFYGDCSKEILNINVLDGFKRLNETPFPVEQYLSQICESRVFINEKTHCIVIIAKRYSDLYVNAVESIWFRIAPWLYPDGKIQDEDEIKIFRSLAENDVNLFISICEKVANEFDLQNMYFKSELCGWNNKCRDEQIQSLENKIRANMDRMADLTSQINSYLIECEKGNMTLEGLRASRQENTSEVFDFFQARNYITLEDVEDNRIYFRIDATIDGYSEEDLDRMMLQRGSLFYSMANELTRKAITGVFKHHLGNFMAESHFYLSSVASLQPLTHCNITNSNAIPHPHLDWHGCLGKNSDFIVDFLKRGEWQMAIDQSVAATKNINFCDGIVIREFFDYVNRNPEKQCIKTSTGFCSPREIAEQYDAIISKEEKIVCQKE